MKRKRFLSYTVASFASVLASPILTSAQNSAGSLSVQWLGHTCFLFVGNGLRILVNPFATLGCTAGYRPPQVEADIVLLSSLLLDEGAATELPGNPEVIYEAGDYEYRGVTFRGVAVPHDLEGGRRFGLNVVWRWELEGIKILHLGGAAAPVEVEEKILMGTPDLALIPVGGGPKAYDPPRAKEAIAVLNPKIVIPTHYLTTGADPLNCDLVSVEEFLALMPDVPTEILTTNQITLTPQNLPATSPLIKVLNYQSQLETIN